MNGEFAVVVLVLRVDEEQRCVGGRRVGGWDAEKGAEGDAGLRHSDRLILMGGEVGEWRL